MTSTTAMTGHQPRAGSGEGVHAHHEEVPDEVAISFHPRTLGQLLFVRSALRLDELDLLLPAAIAMFTEEVGVSPVSHGGGPAYRARLLENANAALLEVGALLLLRIRRGLVPAVVARHALSAQRS
jgi:hypothetical protein